MAEFLGSNTIHQDSAIIAGGIQPKPVDIIATSDRLTTGLIPTNASFISVTSASANNIITLPADSSDRRIGMEIRGWVGANGCEMRTDAGSDETINGVNSDGTNEAAIPATTLFKVTLVAADTWVLEAIDEGGDDIAGIIPD